MDPDVIGLRELGRETLELVGQRGEEILSSHRYVSVPSVRPRGSWWVV